MPVLDFRTETGFQVKVATGPGASALVRDLTYHYLMEVVQAPHPSQVSGDIGEGKTYLGEFVLGGEHWAVTAADKAYIDQLQQLIQATGLQAGNQ